jgi:Tfp pilus assembly protein PilF
MVTELATASIFLSYSWRDKAIADQLDNDLVQMRMNVVRDVRDLRYRGKISDFMAAIRTTDFAILLISDSYLKSKNCMTEVLHLLREREFEKKLLPVIVGDARLYTTKERLEYTRYWKDQMLDLERELAQYSPVSALPALADLKAIGQIHSEINEFISYISDIKHVSFTDLKKEGYRTLLEALGMHDITHLVQLLIISAETDPEKQEIFLEEWFGKYPPMADAYQLRASAARAKGEFDRAERNYIRALELSPNYAEVLNNYGYMLLQLGKEPEKAKRLLEKAIKISPNFTKARLNFAVLLIQQDDIEGARHQNEQVLAYDPTEAKAYNNLANIMQRQPRPFSHRNIEKVKTLYEKAIMLDPQYVEAHLNYGTYLSVIASDFDDADVMLRKALTLDPASEPLVTLLLEQNKRLRERGRPSFKKNAQCPCKSGLRYRDCCAL